MGGEAPGEPRRSNLQDLDLVWPQATRPLGKEGLCTRGHALGLYTKPLHPLAQGGRYDAAERD